MAGRKVKVADAGTGNIVEGVEVDIEESRERWSEFTLSDGSVLRLKVTLISAVRVDGRYDQEGNPSYVIKASPTMVVMDAPESLKKPAQ